MGYDFQSKSSNNQRLCRFGGCDPTSPARAHGPHRGAGLLFFPRGERMAKPLKLESLSSRKMNFNLNSRIGSRLYEMQKPDSNTQKVILSVTTNRIPPFAAITGQLTKSVGLPRNPSSVGSTF